MPDLHDPIKTVARLAPVDRAQVAASWDRSAAKAQVFTQITDTDPQARPDALPDRRPDRRPVRLPRRRLVGALAAAALVLGTVGVGATTLFDQTSYTAGGSVSGVALGDVIDRVGADVPLPPGGSFAKVRQTAVDDGSSQTERGVAGMLAFNAACQWYGHWYTATTTGEVAAAEDALPTLQALPTWRPMTDVDGGGVTGRLRILADSAAAGDTGAVRAFLNTDCGPDAGWDGTTFRP